MHTKKLESDVLTDNKISNNLFGTVLLFTVAYVWFSQCIGECWKAADKEELSAWSIRPHNQSADKNNFQFALISAATHTLVLIGGVLLCNYSSIMSKELFQSSALKATGQWGIILTTSVLFFIACQQFFRTCYESGTGLVYTFAASYFYDLPSSSQPFSIMSSISYSSWLAFGVLVQYLTAKHQSQIELLSKKWALRIALCFVAAAVISRYVFFPLWENSVRPTVDITPDTFHGTFSLMSTLSHTFVLVLGILLAQARLPSTSKLFSYSNIYSLLAMVALTMCIAGVFWGNRYIAPSGPIFTWTFMPSVFLRWISMSITTTLTSSPFAVWGTIAVGYAIERALSSTHTSKTTHVVPHVSQRVADITGTAIVLLGTVAGLLHPEPYVYYTCLVTMSIFMVGGVLLGALLMHGLFRFGGPKLQSYKIQPPKYVLEVKETARAMYVFALLASYPFAQYRMGIPIAIKWSLAEAQPYAPESVVLYAFTVACVTLLVDMYMYIKHYVFHCPELFAFHRTHHTFHDPTPFAGFAVHPLEALVTFGPVLTLCNEKLVVWGQAYAIWVTFFVILNFYLHSGYEIPIIEKTLPMLFINTSCFHNMHHERTVTNFGELLYLWDYVFDTGYHKYGYNKRSTAEIPNVRKANVFLTGKHAKSM